MNTQRRFLKLSSMGWTVLLAGAMAATAPQVLAEAGANTQLQGQVASKLSHDPALQGQNIMVNATGNQVTLSGQVQTEKQWQEAESVTANVSGVGTIQNNLTIAGQNLQNQVQSNDMQAPPPPDADQPEQAAAPEQPATPGNPPPPPPDEQSQQQTQPAYQGNVGQGNAYQGNGEQGQPYGEQNEQGYNQNGNQYGYAQQPSGPVAVPPGTLLQIRTVEPLDSARVQAGQTFDATVARDVWEGNVLAIPRGATLEGVVVKAFEPKGKLGGKPRLDLRLTALEMGGQRYPLRTNVWTSVGPDKAGYSVNNAVKSGLFGAIVGGLIGRGPGALIGAGVGTAAGLGASSATKGPRIFIPSEALLNFDVTAPLTVQPVSEAEARRLASHAPQLLPRPGYGPGYGPYPPPYPRPYGYPPPY